MLISWSGKIEQLHNDHALSKGIMTYYDCQYPKWTDVQLGYYAIRASSPREYSSHWVISNLFTFILHTLVGLHVRYFSYTSGRFPNGTDQYHKDALHRLMLIYLKSKVQNKKDYTWQCLTLQRWFTTPSAHQHFICSNAIL